MECRFSGGGGRFHIYSSYRILFTRKTRYSCIMCGDNISLDEYQVWKERKNMILKALEEKRYVACCETGAAIPVGGD